VRLDLVHHHLLEQGGVLDLHVEPRQLREEPEETGKAQLHESSLENFRQQENLILDFGIVSLIRNHFSLIARVVFVSSS